MAAFAQNPITADAPFQVKYAANPAAGESWINIVNAGANGNALLGPGFGTQAGNICANVYAFSPDEQLISCCSCWVSPNGVANLGVNRDLTIKTLTGVVPTSVVVKVLATLAGTNGGGDKTACQNSAANVQNAPNAPTALAPILGGTYGTTPLPPSTITGAIVPGMAVWGTTLHAKGAGFDTTETAFTPATLSFGELASIGGRCASILGNGSKFGVCQSCQQGALGGVKK
jgi:hypothetical protein